MFKNAQFVVHKWLIIVNAWLWAMMVEAFHQGERNKNTDSKGKEESLPVRCGTASQWGSTKALRTVNESVFMINQTVTFNSPFAIINHHEPFWTFLHHQSIRKSRPTSRVNRWISAGIVVWQHPGTPRVLWDTNHRCSAQPGWCFGSRENSPSWLPPKNDWPANLWWLLVVGWIYGD